MHTIFLFNSLNNFRFFAPTINFFKEKNVNITLIEYEADIYKNINKDYLNPSKLNSEILSNINLIRINTFEEVQNYLVKNLTNYDYIFSIDFLYKNSCIIKDPDLNKILDKWCVISHGMDSFIGLDLKKIYFSYKTNFFFTSNYMYQHGIEYLDKINKDNNFKKFKNIFFIGSSIYDEKIFQKKEQTQKSLVYLPFPFYKNRYRAKTKDFSFQAAFAGKNINLLKIHRKFKGKKYDMNIIFESIKQKFLINYEIYKNYVHIKKYLNHYNENNIILSIRKFCDNNNYKFICKPRLKFPFNETIFKYADEIIYDEERDVYPTKLQKILQKTDLIIGSLSSTVFEAAMFGTPYINIEIPMIAFPKDVDDAFWYNYNEGHYYNYPGVVYSYSIEKFIAKFNNKNSNFFLVDPDKRARYLEKFCGVLSKKDFNVGENIYNFLKQNNQ